MMDTSIRLAKVRWVLIKSNLHLELQALIVHIKSPINTQSKGEHYGLKIISQYFCNNDILDDVTKYSSLVYVSHICVYA